MRHELQEHKHASLQLLWQEYRATHADGYSYSRFCYHYECWKEHLDKLFGKIVREEELALRETKRTSTGAAPI